LKLPKSLWIFGLLVLALVGYFIFNQFTGEINNEGFKQTIAGMKEMVEKIDAGKIEQGEEAFNEVHGFFHDVDPVLKEKDPALAQQLWNAVLQIETQFGSHQPDQEKLIDSGKRVITLLQKAKETL
jgi:hypothetical protein